MKESHNNAHEASSSRAKLTFREIKTLNHGNGDVGGTHHFQPMEFIHVGRERKSSEGRRTCWASLSESVSVKDKSSVTINVARSKPDVKDVKDARLHNPTFDQLMKHPLALLAFVPKDASLFIAGAAAGAAAKTVTAPLDRIKLLMQTHGIRATQESVQKGIGFIEAIRKIGSEEGLKGYWKGNLPQVIRVIPYSAVQLFAYEFYKKLFKGKDMELSVLGRLAAGACAGMTSTLVTYPLDVLRLRLAVDPACKSMSQVAINMLQDEGFGSFYRGLGPSLLGIAPYIAVNFCIFDLVKKSLPEELRKKPEASFATAIISATCATLMCYPLDTVRRQMQMRGSPHKDVLSAFPGATVFLKSIDASGKTKNAEYLCGIMDEVIKDVGEENVVQIVTDNAANYVAAGKLLMERHPHLFWTPCAAHCIDLMLEDLGKLPWIKTVIERGRSVCKFIYNHTWVLNLMRKHNGQRELSRPGVTRFATNFLTLKSLLDSKGGLRRMFVSEEWLASSYATTIAGIAAADHIFDEPSFWTPIADIVTFVKPLIVLLRIADGEKPSMGYIYEGMDRVKEAIHTFFAGNQDRYGPIWDVIDRRWHNLLHRPIHAAAYFLNPAYQFSPHFKADDEVWSGLYDVVERMSSNSAVSTDIVREIELFKKAQGDLFARELCKKNRTTLMPGIIERDGVIGLYRGFIPNALKNLPNSSIRLTTFDAAKALIQASSDKLEKIRNANREFMEDI